MMLFITRKYPPSIGGMQKQSYELTMSIRKITDVYVVSWGKSQLYLPFFLLSALIQSFIFMKRNNVELIHLGDALLSPIGYILKCFYNAPVVVTVSGLDVTFSNDLYQLIITECLKKLDKVICVSNQTRKECLKRGVPAEMCVVIPNGIHVNEYKLNINEHHRRKVEKRCKELIGKEIDLKSNRVILTVGRLVERKGIGFFISRVFPEILKDRRDVYYFIVGEGKLKDKLSYLINELRLQEHVFLWGKVDDDFLKILYNVSDVFVMPNVPIKGDMEGFGIVLLEACSAELCVVGSELEGIKDAIVNGENGLLVRAKDSVAFADTIIKVLRDDEKRKNLGRKARIFTEKAFNWNKISRRYYEEFSELIGTKGSGNG